MCPAGWDGSQPDHESQMVNRRDTDESGSGLRSRDIPAPVAQQCRERQVVTASESFSADSGHDRQEHGERSQVWLTTFGGVRGVRARRVSWLLGRGAPETDAAAKASRAVGPVVHHRGTFGPRGSAVLTQRLQTGSLRDGQHRWEEPRAGDGSAPHGAGQPRSANVTEPAIWGHPARSVVPVQPAVSFLRVVPPSVGRRAPFDSAHRDWQAPGLIGAIGAAVPVSQVGFRGGRGADETLTAVRLTGTPGTGWRSCWSGSGRPCSWRATSSWRSAT